MMALFHTAPLGCEHDEVVCTCHGGPDGVCSTSHCSHHCGHLDCCGEECGPPAANGIASAYRPHTHAYWLGFEFTLAGSVRPVGHPTSSDGGNPCGVSLLGDGPLRCEAPTCFVPRVAVSHVSLAAADLATIAGLHSRDAVRLDTARKLPLLCDAARHERSGVLLL